MSISAAAVRFRSSIHTLHLARAWPTGGPQEKLAVTTITILAFGKPIFQKTQAQNKEQDATAQVTSGVRWSILQISEARRGEASFQGTQYKTEVG